MSQFMLEITISDGLLASYAKLDALETVITKKNRQFGYSKSIYKMDYSS
jgi:hypothetical protein